MAQKNLKVLKMTQEMQDKRALAIAIALFVVVIGFIVITQIFSTRSDIEWSDKRFNVLKSQIENDSGISNFGVSKLCFHNQQGPYNNGKLNCGAILSGKFITKDKETRVAILNNIRNGSISSAVLNSPVGYGDDNSILNEKNLNCSLISSTLPADNLTDLEIKFKLICYKESGWKFYGEDETLGQSALLGT